MALKTIIINSGSQFEIPSDFVSLVAVHAISAGGNGQTGAAGGYAGAYIGITGADAAGANLSAGAVLNIQIGTGYDQTDPDLQVAETWMEDADGALMILAPPGYVGWGIGFNPVTVPVPCPDTGGGKTFHAPFPNDGRVSWGADYQELSGGAAGGPRKFIDSPNPLDSGAPGFAINGVAIPNSRAQGGGGAAIVDPDGAGWPNFRGDGVADAYILSGDYAVGGDGSNNDNGVGGSTLEPSVDASLGGGGRGGAPPVESPVGERDGGFGGNGQTWQDTDTLEWAGPGGGGGGGGGFGGNPDFGGRGGDGGLYGGAAGGGFSDDA